MSVPARGIARHLVIAGSVTVGLLGGGAAALAAQANEQVEYRRYVPPALSARSDDHVHSDYNAYLAQLAAADNDEPGTAK